MNNPVKQLTRAAASAAVLVLLAVLPAISVYIDLKILDNGIGEISVTEISQESMLLASAIMFFVGARRTPASRGFLLLAAGFFSCLFIRETDWFLDNIWHGFWVYPASLMALGCMLAARFACAGSTLQPLADFTGSRPYLFILFGLITLLILSRTFGSGNLLWNHLLPEDYAFGFKTAIQEGLELYSYSLIFYGSCLFAASGFNSQKHQ